MLVTGAFSGVGWSVTDYLARRGYNVLAVDKQGLRDSGKNTANFCAPKIHELIVDFDSRDAYEKIESYINSRKICLDGMFAYAGISPLLSIRCCDQDSYDQVMDINLKSSFFLTQIFLRHKNCDSGGSIVYCGSPHQFVGDMDRAVYAISKGALMTLNRHVSTHYMKEKVRSNIVILGWTRTEGEISLRTGLGISEDDLSRLASEKTPLGRLVEVNEYNELLEFLLSDRSSLVTGSVIDSSGGLHV